MSLDILDLVRVAIAGPSWWADFWHLPALELHPQAEIVGICGERTRETTEVRTKYGAAAHYFTQLETMLDTVKPDGLIVCTPNDLHYPATMAALRRGIHVLCEKPIAMHAAQAQEMAQTAQREHLVGMTNFTYRGNSALQKMQQLIQAGHIGTLLHLAGSYHGGYALGRPPGWRGTRQRSGSGILGDLGSHLIDMARYVTGDEFASVCAHTLTALWQEKEPEASPTLCRTEAREAGPRNDDSCAFLAEFRSGMQGVFHTSWIAYQGAEGQRQELEIYGTRGRLRFTASFRGTALYATQKGRDDWETIPVEGITHPDEAKETHEDYFRPGRLNKTNNVYRWIDAIAKGQPAIAPSLEDGWRAQQVIEAVLQASAVRRWIEVV